MTCAALGVFFAKGVRTAYLCMRLVLFSPVHTTYLCVWLYLPRLCERPAPGFWGELLWWARTTWSCVAQGFGMALERLRAHNLLEHKGAVDSLCWWLTCHRCVYVWIRILLYVYFSRWRCGPFIVMYTTSLIRYSLTWYSNSLFSLTRRFLISSAISRTVECHGPYPAVVRRVIHRTNSFSSAWVSSWLRSCACWRLFDFPLTRSRRVLNASSSFSFYLKEMSWKDLSYGRKTRIGWWT